MMVNWWKEWIDFVEIKFAFEWKYWMTLYATWIEFRFNSIQLNYKFNNWIKIIEFNSNSIEENEMQNSWRRYWKSTH
jgi:hypothetical protein